MSVSDEGEQRTADTSAGFVAFSRRMKELEIHLGIGLADVRGVYCVTCGESWPCEPAQLERLVRGL